MINLLHGDCLELMKSIPDKSINLAVTSPPYDNLRNYNGTLDWNFDIFKAIALEIARVLEVGGVIVWIVNDSTIKGSETGSSFKQALYFKEECGLNLHDTMIWEKTGRIPTQDRYYAVTEYMFIFSKGKPRAMNFICDHKTVNGGRIQKKDACINKGKQKEGQGTFIRAHFSRRSNIWKIHVGENSTGHPAVFPLKLAQDHIISWSNEGDTVLDPFMGSGTTGLACKNLNRNFIGIEKDDKYFEIAKNRINND